MVGDNVAEVGQIGNGVYVARNNTYMKIGYTPWEPSGWGGIFSFWKTVPLSFDKYVAWIGADDAVYVATIDVNHLVSTGIQNVPRYVPFREQHTPTVYQEDGKSYTDTQLTAFKSAAAYIAAYNDPTFSKVIWINDGVITAKQKSNTK